MPRWGLTLALLVTGLTTSTAMSASDEYERVQLVSERRGLMFDIQTAYLSLLSVNQGSSNDLKQAAEDAKTIGEKLDAFVSLLQPDTASGQVPNSRAKQEIWSDADTFAAVVDALRAESARLWTIASEADLDRFDTQFDAFAKACTGCHGLRPSSGGKFRIESQF